MWFKDYNLINQLSLSQGSWDFLYKTRPASKSQICPPYWGRSVSHHFWLLFLNYMYAECCVCRCMYGVCPWRPKVGVRFPEAGVVGCKLPDLSAPAGAAPRS